MSCQKGAWLVSSQNPFWNNTDIDHKHPFCMEHKRGSSFAVMSFYPNNSKGLFKKDWRVSKKEIHCKAGGDLALSYFCPCPGDIDFGIIKLKLFLRYFLVWNTFYQVTYLWWLKILIFKCWKHVNVEPTYNSQSLVMMIWHLTMYILAVKRSTIYYVIMVIMLQCIWVCLRRWKRCSLLYMININVCQFPLPKIRRQIYNWSFWTAPNTYNFIQSKYPTQIRQEVH